MNKETRCEDNFDNDNDGLVDLEDQDCLVTCLDISGQECSSTEQCDVSTRKTLDADACCTGSCTPSEVSCKSQSGEFCTLNQQCDGNRVAASDAAGANFCCVGTCKSKLVIWPWILFLIILLLAGGIFFLYKRGDLDKYKKYFQFGKKAPADKPTPFRPPVRPYVQTQNSPPPFTHRPAMTSRHYPEGKADTKTESELKETMEKLKNYTGEK